MYEKERREKNVKKDAKKVMFKRDAPQAKKQGKLQRTKSTKKTTKVHVKKNNTNPSLPPPSCFCFSFQCFGLLTFALLIACLYMYL
jgi:hypothetical protein